MAILSYSQNFEDVMLWRAFKDVPQGFYIDVGAGHPDHHSVTRLFYDRGWHGINVEPATPFFVRLQRSRIRDINLNIALGAAPGRKTFYTLPEPGLSTLHLHIAESHSRPGWTFKEQVVACETLANICRTYVRNEIHFLKIDVEGAERDVLAGADLRSFRPRIIVVQAARPMSPEPNQHEWEPLLLDAAYHLIWFDGLNRFYCAEESFATMQPHFVVPPNVFDDFLRSVDTDAVRQMSELRVALDERMTGERLRTAGERGRADSASRRLSEHEKSLLELTRRLAESEAQADEQRRRLSATGARLGIKGAQVEEQRRGLGTAAARLSAAEAQLCAAEARLRVVEADAAEHRRLAAEYGHVVDAMRASTSWRLTAPIRRVGIMARRLLGRSAAPTVMDPHDMGEDVPTPHRALPSNADATSWFYVGDTVQWLMTHKHLTGIGRVTTEILAAILSDSNWPQVRLCLLRGEELVPCAPEDHVALREQSAAAADLHASISRASPAKHAPKSGDHVLFAGVVRTPAFAALFRRLRAQGIRFSVIVYDLIPISHPEFSDARTSEGFLQWLQAVLNDAELIFTPTKETREQLYRWALADGFGPRNPICLIPLGHSHSRTAAPGLRPAVPRTFVLSVGTIDHRKNQLFLCAAWAELAAEQEIPVLVLAGRDDLGLTCADPAVAALIRSGDIRILTDVDDAALHALYDSALFTVFPSLSEGYGLPVADSLAYGKLCLASDLAVIREWAGDLVWYFDPRDEASLIGQLRRALYDSQARAAAEAHLASWRPTSWADVARRMHDAISALSLLPDPDSSDLTDVAVPTLLPASQIVNRCRCWCVADAPQVSIIVVNWNAVGMTSACVRHLWANTTGARYEILIADNGSDPAKLHTLDGVGGGLHLLQLGTNRYFGEANNIAVEAARGELIVLLNNDVFVKPGWLEALLDALRAAPSAGAVGPIFLFPDGTIQEAGGLIDENGYPLRLFRGEPGSKCSEARDRIVDYISAACLLMPRSLFLRVGGFDLTYEPAYYEDVDLCLKLAALGHPVHLAAAAEVVHIEGYSTGDNIIPSQQKNALGDINRRKFLARWETYITSRDRSAIEAIGTLVMPPNNQRCTNRSTRRALIYSPFDLTVGAGERYLLTLAAALARDYAVTIATLHPYSELRLGQLAREFCIDLSTCNIAVLDALSGDWDLMVALGNHVTPTIPARGKQSFFVCQFPFPLPPDKVPDHTMLTGYHAILAYSSYAKRYIETAIARFGMPRRPVHVLYPPVPEVPFNGQAKSPMILTVGRFVSGGHSKRHDVLIEAFRNLCSRHQGSIELHLVGSSMPDRMHMEYLANLREIAIGLPILFHVNASRRVLETLYQESAFYWHGTGLGGDLEKSPELAEHFGIAIVEAMSAGCVAFAPNAGGATEIITDNVDGCLYDTPESLVERTLVLLEDAPRRQSISTRARERIKDFTVARFVAAVQALASA